MGRTVIPVVRLPVGREEFHLGRARTAFVSGSIEVDEFETMVAHVLAGGYLGERLELRTAAMDLRDRERAVKRARATCSRKGHELVEITGRASFEPEFICARCGEATSDPLPGFVIRDPTVPA